MIWIVVIIIAIIVVVNISSKQEKVNSKPIDPPDADVAVMGCMLGCGYYTPHMYKRSNGEIEMSENKGHCSYMNKEVVWGTHCSFADEHPELLTPGIFTSMTFDE